MHLYWLSLLPLASAGATGLLRGQRKWAAWFGLLTVLVCLGVVWGAPLDQSSLFLGQTWILDPLARLVLLGVYISVAILMAVAALSDEGGPFLAPALASTGILSAAVLVRPLPLAFMLLPAAVLVLVLAARPRVHNLGAAWFLALATLPVPLLLAAFKLLQRLDLFPEQPAPAILAALLIVPAAVLWLNLLPFTRPARSWAADGLPLAPAFLWTAKDWVVLYLLHVLWRETPVLHIEAVTFSLYVVGLATALCSGVWALWQSDPGALLACAATSELGIAMQGLMAGSRESLMGGLFLLLGRTIVILLACSALAAWPRFKGEKHDAPPAWPYGWIAPAAFSVAILALAGVPAFSGFLGRTQVLQGAPNEGHGLWLVWLAAGVGVGLGWLRSVWPVWRTVLRGAQQRPHTALLVLMVALGLLSLWLGLFPAAAQRLIEDITLRLLPFSTL